MKHDLKTQEGRKNVVIEVENSFIESLRNLGVELHENAVCSILGNKISIAILNEKGIWEFVSDVDLRINRDGICTINFGSSGEFSPKVAASYWRTIHAASILKNWDDVFIMVKAFCLTMSKLQSKIRDVANG